MNVKLVNKGNTGELILIGRLDSTTVADVEKIMMDIASRFDDVTLNLGELEYISSAGLRAILKLRQTMDKKNGELFISNVKPFVMEVFEMTGFAGILNFV